MTSQFAKIIYCEEFSRDFKKLLKRYRSFKEDLEIFIEAQLYSFHKLHIDNHGVTRINNIGFDSPPIYKARKFACRALKGKGSRSGIHIIYAYMMETDEIIFFEIYSKTDKQNEDRERIRERLLKKGYQNG